MVDPHSSDVKLPRISKGQRSRFFPDPAMDQMMTYLLELMAEFTALRERMDTIEHLLEDKVSISRADIENYQPDSATEAARAQWTQAFIQRVMRQHAPS